MLDSFLASLLRTIADASEWWESISTTDRAAACLLVSIFLMWEATKANSSTRDRKFFLSGFVAICLLIYGAVLFTQGGVR